MNTQKSELMKNNILPALCLLSGILLPYAKAYADGVHNEWVGNGANGANRVARSSFSGFVGVKGDFTVPTFSIPVISTVKPGTTTLDPSKPKVNLNLVGPNLSYTDESLAKYSDKTYNRHSNPQNSKPTFYLGSNSALGVGHAESDAGLQYEWLPVWGAKPGWSAFLRTTAAGNNWKSPYHNTNFPAYRVGPGTQYPNVTSFSLEHTIATSGATSGSVFIRIIFKDRAITMGVGPSLGYAAPYNIATYTTAQIRNNQIQMKRVIGITQSGHAALDNSWMTGCTFSNGQLGSIGGGGLTYGAWTRTKVDNANTGYIPGVPPSAAGWPVGDLDLGTPPHYRVDFPGISSSAPSVLSLQNIRENYHNANSNINPTVAGRYANERVDIYLRRGRAVHGLTVTVKGATAK